MVKALSLYLDDSGTRHPTNKPGRKAEHGYDWFALGGVLVRDEDEEEAKAIHKVFVDRWPLARNVPLHSSEIRSQNENFLWLREIGKEERDRFYEELFVMMQDAPVIGVACVIDRPGYVTRYLEKFEQNPWMLCKTAFTVVVERAAKFARQNESKLRVFPERCNKSEDALLRSYYADLRSEGSPFGSENSGKYGPLTQSQFHETLYELDFKRKTSPMAQFADLYLWPICMGGYHTGNRPYKRLLENGKLIEAHVDAEMISTLASKYSCFENVTPKA